MWFTLTFRDRSRKSSFAILPDRISKPGQESAPRKVRVNHIIDGEGRECAKGAGSLGRDSGSAKRTCLLSSSQPPFVHSSQRPSEAVGDEALTAGFVLHHPEPFRGVMPYYGVPFLFTLPQEPDRTRIPSFRTPVPTRRMGLLYCFPSLAPLSLPTSCPTRSTFSLVGSGCVEHIRDTR